MIIRFLLVACFLKFSIQAIGQDKESIRKTNNPSGWLIKTASSCYQLTVNANGSLKPVFYGPAAQADHLLRNANWTESIEEVPVRGGYPFKTPMLEVVFNNGVRDLDLRYVNGEIITLEGRPTLKIVQRDSLYPLEVT